MNTVGFCLDGKVAIVTGASRGIGEAMARAMAAAGATVVLASRKQEALDAIAASIRSDGGTAVPIACHTGQIEMVDALVSRVKAELGRIDVLVNNAATNPYFGPAIGISESLYDKTFEVNTKGYFMMAQRVAPVMVDQGRGSIINIASTAGITPYPLQGVYAMTKAAVIMMTKVFAKELGGAGVRCNAICPGLTETRFAKVLIETPEIHDLYLKDTPMGRHAQPIEMVGAALYLASDAASYTNGAILVCDGGQSI
ncbi:MAG TPA: glucose 1-dehydrogenase [Candidatus Hydrogenedentes bacterium]|nr:glucose 1-dehydrogenase [Candidatus Hydrogenedentota bacterium]HPG66390.1 glucose 1-dehydrogenase [Candidatus Hydrogenedentota bacterium]